MEGLGSMIRSVEQTGDLQVPPVTVTGGEIGELQQFSHRQHLSSNDSGGLGEFEWNHLELADKNICLEVGNLFFGVFPLRWFIVRQIFSHHPIICCCFPGHFGRISLGVYVGFVYRTHPKMVVSFVVLSF